MPHKRRHRRRRQQIVIDWDPIVRAKMVELGMRSDRVFAHDAGFPALLPTSFVFVPPCRVAARSLSVVVAFRGDGHRVILAEFLPLLDRVRVLRVAQNAHLASEYAAFTLGAPAAKRRAVLRVHPPSSRGEDLVSSLQYFLGKTFYYPKPFPLARFKIRSHQNTVIIKDQHGAFFVVRRAPSFVARYNIHRGQPRFSLFDHADVRELGVQVSTFCGADGATVRCTFSPVDSASALSYGRKPRPLVFTAAVDDDAQLDSARDVESTLPQLRAGIFTFDGLHIT